MRPPRLARFAALAGLALVLAAAPSALAGPAGISQLYAGHRVGAHLTNYRAYDAPRHADCCEEHARVYVGGDHVPQRWRNGYYQHHEWHYRPGAFVYVDDPGALGSPQRYLHFRDRSYDRGYGHRSGLRRYDRLNRY
jgi:hypothetical protein